MQNLFIRAEHIQHNQMQFVSAGSTNKSSYDNNNNTREEASNPEPPRFAEDGKSLFERLKDNKEKQIQFDSERVTAGGPSAISEEEYMFFIELQRKQQHLAKQVDRETQAFQKQVQSLSYHPPDTALLTIVAPKSNKSAKRDKKPALNVRPKSDVDVTVGDKRKTRELEELPAAKRSKLEEHDTNKDADKTDNTSAHNDGEEAESGSGLAALLGYGSDSE